MRPRRPCQIQVRYDFAKYATADDRHKLRSFENHAGVSIELGSLKRTPAVRREVERATQRIQCLSSKVIHSDSVSYIRVVYTTYHNDMTIRD